MSNPLVVKEVKEGMQIEYIGESFAFGGKYKTVSVESTYIHMEDCTVGERGKLVIIEFMNDDTPMFFSLDTLNPKDWRLVR